MRLFTRLWFWILLVVLLGGGVAGIGFSGIFPKFSFPNPFKQVIQIDNTQVEIKEIKEIGELITAEFYGEVCGDLNEAYEDILNEYQQRIQKTPDVSGTYKDSLQQIYPMFEKVLQQKDKIKANKQGFETQTQDFNRQTQAFLAHQKEINDSIAQWNKRKEGVDAQRKELEEKNKSVQTEIESVESQKKEIEKKMRDLKGFLGLKRNKDKEAIAQNEQSLNELKDKLKTLENQVDENVSKIKELKKTTQPIEEQIEEVKKAFVKIEKNYEKDKKTFEKEKSDYDKALQKLVSEDKTLVYIGRGWVKAGFNLNNMQKDDIEVSKHKDTTLITISVDSAAIIVKDINPWYINTAKQQIKGYELFVKKGKESSFTDEEVKRVKAKCKLKLEEESLRKGILNKAQSSGVETLQRFFKALGFKEVIVKFKVRKK